MSFDHHSGCRPSLPIPGKSLGLERQAASTNIRSRVESTRIRMNRTTGDDSDLMRIISSHHNDKASKKNMQMMGREIELSQQRYATLG